MFKVHRLVRKVAGSWRTDGTGLPTEWELFQNILTYRVSLSVNTRLCSPRMERLECEAYCLPLSNTKKLSSCSVIQEFFCFFFTETGSSLIRSRVPANPRSLITFHNMLLFMATLKMKDHHLSAVRNCVFSTFATSLHIWKPFPLTQIYLRICLLFAI
jgi:hypothetical protein